MIERGSIIFDFDITKVAKIRRALEQRWEEKVDISDVLIGLLRLDRTEELEAEYDTWLWSLPDRIFYEEFLEEIPICDPEEEEEEGSK